MRVLWSFVVLPLLGFSLAACSTAQCDPSQGGFFRGVGCASSGTYSQRKDEKQTVINQETQKQTALQSDYKKASDEQAAVAAQRREAERKYAALQSDLGSMKAKLANSKTQNKALEQKVADLERKTSMLKQDAFTPEAEKAKRLQSLQAQKDDLEREIDLALQ